MKGGEMEKRGEKRQEKARRVGRDIISVIIYLTVILTLTFGVVHFVGQRTVVSGESMKNALSDGDNLIVDKITYHLHDPERFDIIIFPYQYKENTYYIKRIIGLPGETVQIDAKGTIYIDGNVLEEDFGNASIEDPGLAAAPVTLGDDEYFVLGDNRNASEDSRFSDVANIKRDQILGRAWLRIYPFTEVSLLEHPTDPIEKIEENNFIEEKTADWGTIQGVPES